MAPQRSIRTFLSWTLLVVSLHAGAVTAPPLDPAGGRVEDRQQLRTLLEAMEAGINRLDLEALLTLAQPDVVITWQNAEVSRGHEQVRAYHARMVKGPAPVVGTLSTRATLGGPAVFYGDTAVAYGRMVDRYELTEGLAFTLNANWSTTVTKTDGQWKVAALHFSTNLFDNTLLDAAKRSAWFAAAGGLILGIVATWLVGRVRRKGA